MALAWLATGALTVTVLVPLVARAHGLVSVDGTWFLPPAALLADGIGVAAVGGAASSRFATAGWLALAAACAGVVAYALVVVLAAARLCAHRLAGAPRSPWWIAAGCGGLSAAALGRVSAALPVGAGAGAFHALGLAALACWSIGGVALVVVLAGSVQFVTRLRRVGGRPPWTPTFSTGVFALGAGQVGRLLGAPAIARTADVCGAVTLCLWVLTVVAYVAALGARVVRVRPAATPTGGVPGRSRTASAHHSVVELPSRTGRRLFGVDSGARPRAGARRSAREVPLERDDPAGGEPARHT